MDTTLDRLADFIAATRFAQLPEPLVAQAKRHLLDTLGAALAGCDSPIWRECRALVAEEGGSAVAQLWGCAQQASPRRRRGSTAWRRTCMNWTTPAAAITPVPWCYRRCWRRCRWRRSRSTDGHFSPRWSWVMTSAAACWKPAGLCGAQRCGLALNCQLWRFGAAAAVSCLLRLPAAQCASALGIAASFSGGLWGFIHDGSHTKSCTRARRKGAQAALLAQRGISGPAAVFEARWGGFLQTGR